LEIYTLNNLSGDFIKTIDIELYLICLNFKKL
jgi:hypothetical protein